MIEADHARQLPAICVLLPHLNELGLSGYLSAFERMPEPVHPDLHRSVALKGIHLKRSRHQLSRDLPTDVLLECGEQRRLTDAQPRLVVVELDVVADQFPEFVQFAAVIRAKQLCIHS